MAANGATNGSKPTYTDEYRCQIAQRVVEGGESASKVAQDEHVAKSTVTRWVNDYKCGTLDESGTLSVGAAQALKVRELEGELAEAQATIIALKASLKACL